MLNKTGENNIKTGEESIITLHLMQAERTKRDEFGKSVIIFVLKGSISLSVGNTVNKEIFSGEMVLIPPLKNYEFKGLENDNHIMMYFNISFQPIIGGKYSINDLLPYIKDKDNGLLAMKIRQELHFCLNITDICIANGLKYGYLEELKRSEIIYLLFELYPPKELAVFFSPLLNEDIQFRDAVLKNSLHAKNVIELASLSNYSTSGFIKRFKKYFNESPYKWMQKQKAENILFDLKQGNKTAKQVAFEHHFLSYEHFIRFCKSQYGCTPTEIVRKNHSNKSNH